MGSENIPQRNIRTEELNVVRKESTLWEEKGILERYPKAKRLAGVLALVSALSVAPGTVSDVHAQTKKPDTTAGETQKNQEENIDASKLTKSGTWSRSIAVAARTDMKKLNTIDGANWLLRDYFGHFVSEYYMPTEGVMKDGPYGTKIRVSTLDDLKLILQNANEMKNILEELNAQFAVEAHQTRIEQIDDIIKKVRVESSYDAQKRIKVLDKF